MYLRNLFLALAALVAIALPEGALAQVVSQQPKFVAPLAWLDVGNGPTEVLPLNGNGKLYSRMGTATSTAVSASTTMTLAATPTYAPCVGCVISGTGITAGTTVAAYNGTTGITLSAAMTVANNTVVSFGVACPTSGVPTPGDTSYSPPLELRAGSERTIGIPFYSYARLCAYSDTQAGLTFATFPIGAW
jgi:hypothetical protein